MVMTPNGRFELNKKICISFTSYHEELWQPAWGIRTAIIGLQGFFPLKGEAALGVGALDMPIQERQRLAKLSRDWVCPHCETRNVDILPDPPATESNDSPSDPQVVDSSTAPNDAEKTELFPSRPDVIVETPLVPPDSDPSNPGIPTAAAISTESSSIAPLSAAEEASVPQPQAQLQPQPPTPDTTTARVPPRPAAVPPQDAFIIPRPPIILDTVIFILGSLFLAILTKKLLHLFVGNAVENVSPL
jgi:ubiquitin-conjugating enzyme E2 J1